MVVYLADLSGMGSATVALTWDGGVALLELLGEVSPSTGPDQGSESSPTGNHGPIMAGYGPYLVRELTRGPKYRTY